MERKGTSVAGPGDVLHRILGTTVMQHFKVNVGASGSAGAAHQGHYLPLLYDVTDIDFDGLAVAVAGNQTITVINLHQKMCYFVTKNVVSSELQPVNRSPKINLELILKVCHS